MNINNKLFVIKKIRLPKAKGIHSLKKQLNNLFGDILQGFIREEVDF